MKLVTLQGVPKSELKIDGNKARILCIFKTQMGQSPICVLKMHETPFNSIDFMLPFRHSLKRYMFHVRVYT